MEWPTAVDDGIAHPGPAAGTVGEPAWADEPVGTTVLTRDAVLRQAVRLAEAIPGHIIEFGVADGSSTRVLRSELRRLQFGRLAGGRKRIFACDSFQGLPERYERLEAGAFAGRRPRLAGVRIVEGYFDQSLTGDLAAEVGSVALASLDADLYSSTMTALRWLTPLLRTGSLLLFDEYLGGGEAEKRAFEDWSGEAGLSTVVVATYRREPSGWSSQPDVRVLHQVVDRGSPAVGPVGPLSLSSAGRRGRGRRRRRCGPPARPASTGSGASTTGSSATDRRPAERRTDAGSGGVPPPPEGLVR